MMHILSLFDGMACGMLALEAAGVQVDSYAAYEVEEAAKKTAKANFPMIEELGDVFTADFTKHENVDFLLGGSPCTYWSVAQNINKRETEASGLGWNLFQQYIRALHEAKPRYFIYENNHSMSTTIRDSISQAFGFEPIYINSNRFTAQNRQRLYWIGKRTDSGAYARVEITNIPSEGIKLKDILDDDLTAEERIVISDTESLRLAIQRGKMCGYDTFGTPSFGVQRAKTGTHCIGYTRRDTRAQGYRVYDVLGNSPCLRGQSHDRCCELWLIPLEAKPNTIIPYGYTKHGTALYAWNVKTGLKHRIYLVKDGKLQVNRRKYKVDVPDGSYIISKPLMSELRKLQGIPTGYRFDDVGACRAYKLMGNGWTIPVITCLIQHCLSS